MPGFSGMPGLPVRLDIFLENIFREYLSYFAFVSNLSVIY